MTDYELVYIITFKIFVRRKPYLLTTEDEDYIRDTVLGLTTS